jgi:hypothetical protein
MTETTDLAVGCAVTALVWALVIGLNLAFLAGSVWVVAFVLRAMGVL